MLRSQVYPSGRPQLSLPGCPEEPGLRLESSLLPPSTTQTVTKSSPSPSCISHNSQVFSATQPLPQLRTAFPQVTATCPNQPLPQPASAPLWPCPSLALPRLLSTLLLW